MGIKFEVTDSGIGISKENLKLLFNDYGKIISEANDALNPQGIGLGLIISKILAEELSPESKKFQIISEIGKGTTFIFYLSCPMKEENSPKIKISMSKLSKDDNFFFENENVEIKNQNFEILKKPEIPFEKANAFRELENKLQNKLLYSSSNELINNKNNSSNASNNATLFPMEKCICPKLLVVDDDMFNVLCLQELLKNLGFESDFAANGSEAIAKVNNRNEKKCCESCQEFKLIFMDSYMPVLNGIETTKILKQLEFLNHIKIIACSGDKNFEKFQMAGCDGVLEKPILKNKLAKILNDYKILLEK